MIKNNLKVVKSTKDQDLEKKEKNKALDAAISQIADTFGNETWPTNSNGH
jgi:recombination protein RecA